MTTAHSENAAAPDAWVPAETVPEPGVLHAFGIPPEPEPARPASRPGWLWALMPGARGRAARLARLNDAIAASPDEPANYLLRGELLNEEGRCELAAADFERALALARAGLPDESWGLVGQVLQDRALAGLARADAER